jgi:hypothetical protein
VLEADIRRAVESDLRKLNLAGSHAGKEALRKLHAPAVHDLAKKKQRLLADAKLYSEAHFASGADITPSDINPYLIPVVRNSPEADIFNVATLLWSVPVSSGYGRRMRYLVKDRQNGRLLGIIGLCDPVFSLAPRDDFLGWTIDDRKRRLYNLLDAYVLGAVPPYNMILGGKLVALLALSTDVSSAFAIKYRESPALQKRGGEPYLAAVTTISALGKSSIYNRLRLSGESAPAFISVGYTSGWGHFHISPYTLILMRKLLRRKQLGYADDYEYGGLSNWRFRTIRRALQELGLPESLLQHGVKREVFIAPLLHNIREMLSGRSSCPIKIGRDLSNIVEYCKERWIIPRSVRNATWRTWRHTDTADQMTKALSSSSDDGSRDDHYDDD